MDAEPSRDVVRGRHDAAPVRVAADDQRLLAELGILELLDGGVERVEVEMGDDAGHGHANKRTLPAPTARPSGYGVPERR